MKHIYNKLGVVVVLLLTIFMHACDDIDPIIEKIQYARVFSPLGMDVKVRNQLTAEISWQVSDSVDHYVLEISNDSLEFNNIVYTQEVLPTEVPFSVLLEGEEQYSARVKGVSKIETKEESKWSAFPFKTDAENIFNPLTDDNIGKTDVTLSWPTASEVTHFIITPGDVKRNLSVDEIAAGSATITGLEFDTEYKVIMYNGTAPKQRGDVTFTTLPEGETLTPEVDLLEKFANAADGDIFLLEGGTYTTQGIINLTKNITIKGLSASNMPILNVQFVIAEGATDVKISGVELYGKYTDPTDAVQLLDHAVQILPVGGAMLGNFEMSGCVVKQYNKSLIGASSGAWSIDNVIIDNCVVDSIIGNGGDMIDFRKSFVAYLTVTNSTFSNCSLDGNSRQFIRLDGSDKGPNTYDDGAHTPTVEVSYCTFYSVLNYESSSAQHFFYVRWINSDEVLISKNNIFSTMSTTVYGRDSRCETTNASFDKNNYFNSTGFYDSSMKVYDNSSTYTTEDPGFSDAAKGDFTISNQTLIDNAIGDPRWR